MVDLYMFQKEDPQKLCITLMRNIIGVVGRLNKEMKNNYYPITHPMVQKHFAQIKQRILGGTGTIIIGALMKL